jgi:hypothetical protein
VIFLLAGCGTSRSIFLCDYHWSIFCRPAPPLPLICGYFLLCLFQSFEMDVLWSLCCLLVALHSFNGFSFIVTYRKQPKAKKICKKKKKKRIKIWKVTKHKSLYKIKFISSKLLDCNNQLDWFYVECNKLTR